MKTRWVDMPKFISSLLVVLYAKRTADLGTMNEGVRDMKDALPSGADSYTFVSPDRRHKITVTVKITENTGE